MSKSGAAIVGIWLLIVAAGTVAVFAAHWVNHRVWARAAARARWVPHTDEVGSEADGTPIVRVTVQLVAQSRGRRRVLRPPVVVGQCPVRYAGDSALLDLEAAAVNHAETRNALLRGEENR